MENIPLIEVKAIDNSATAIYAALFDAARRLHGLQGKLSDTVTDAVTEISVPHSFDNLGAIALADKFNVLISRTSANFIRVYGREGVWAKVILPSVPKMDTEKLPMNRYNPGSEEMGGSDFEERLPPRSCLPIIGLAQADGYTERGRFDDDVTVKEMLEHYEELPDGFEVDVKFFKMVCRELCVWRKAGEILDEALLAIQRECSDILEKE